jgi:hypothetical protein
LPLANQSPSTAISEFALDFSINQRFSDALIDSNAFGFL